MMRHLIIESFISDTNKKYMKKNINATLEHKIVRNLGNRDK